MSAPFDTLQPAGSALDHQKIKMRFWVFLTVFIITTSSSQAETALEVQSWCTTTAHAPLLADGKVGLGTTFDDGFCWGAFAAIQDLSRIEMLGNPLLVFCPPSNSTRIEYVKIFLRYVDQHPEQLHMDFAGVARRALAAAFPCTPPN
jgi:Rap1a immunity proteins